MQQPRRFIPLLSVLSVFLGVGACDTDDHDDPQGRNARAEGDPMDRLDLQDTHADEADECEDVSPPPLDPDSDSDSEPEPEEPQPFEPCEGIQAFDLERLADLTMSDDEVILDCATSSGYEVSSLRNLNSPDAQLWVAGVYETRSDHSGKHHPMGAAHVTWTRSGDNVLVLSAYEPTTWRVSREGEGELSRIIVVGYHEQFVDFADDMPEVPVEIHSYFAQGSACNITCGYALPGEGGGCEGEALVAVAEAISGRELTGFDGCYRATNFRY